MNYVILTNTKIFFLSSESQDKIVSSGQANFCSNLFKTYFILYRPSQDEISHLIKIVMTIKFNLYQYQLMLLTRLIF